MGDIAMGLGDDGHAGPLAEFAALRQEIERRSQIQHNIFTLQLTISGAVFSFALSNHARVYFLLIVPISTYMLAGRYVTQHFGIIYAGKYIKEVLGALVPGGLGWERWLIDHRRRQLFFLEWADPHYVTYPGISVLALAWLAPQVIVTHGMPLLVWFGIISLWTIGLVATVASFYLVWFARRGWWRLHNRWLPPKPNSSVSAI
jgi:hypothetical protein